MKVTVCVITFRRPSGLRKVLEGLRQQAMERNPAVWFEVVVVDNDDRGEAAGICAEMSVPFPLRCVTEATRGIPFARNRGVMEANRATDFIAFIDDDECPARIWLDELCTVQRAFDADVVTGPVLPAYPADAPAWMIDGGFFERRRHPDGSAITYARSGNVLIRRSVLPVKEPFNIRMPMTGGTDTLLFMSLRREGCTFHWADHAIVYEDVQRQRMTTRWILRRAYRLGNSLSLCDRMLGLTLRSASVRIGKGAGRILLGVLSLPVVLVRGRGAALRAFGDVARGLGMIFGVMGFQFEEYRKPS